MNLVTSENCGRNRIAYLDVLRVMATFAVVFLHVVCKDYFLSDKSYDWYVAVVGDSLVRWSVPMFVMISGALFLNPNKHVTIKGLLKKNVFRLLIAYLFWYAAYIVINTIYACISKGVFSLGAVSWSPQYHLWFLPMLIGVYLLVPILRKIAIECTLLRYALILWSCYITISFLLIKEIPQITDLFKMNIIWGYCGYFLLGFFLSNIQLKKRTQVLLYILGIIGGGITIAGGLIPIGGWNKEMFLSYVSPHVALMTTALFVLLKQKASKIKKKTLAIVSYVRADLFGIYLTHGIWLILFNRSFFRDFANPIITMPLISFVVFIFSLYTTKLIRMIPKLSRVVE